MIYGLLYLIFVVCIQFSKCSSIEQLTTSFIKSRSLFDAVEILIPTLHSENELCRNHSRFYLQELKNFRLWATEMFDASSKFPSGVVSGSVYDLGNFDECIAIKVPLPEENYELLGQYCLAKFKIKPLKYSGNRLSYEIENDPMQFNISAWEKVAAFSSDRSKGPRNEIYFSFCIPSSCTHDDLETSLKQQLKKHLKSDEFTLEISVDERHCQVKQQYQLTAGDIVFLTVVGLFVFACLFATFYNLLTKLEDLRQFKLPPSAHQMVKYFSLSYNLNKLGKNTNDGDGLDCIHGMKAISMFLIIMGHRIMFEVGSPIVNPSFVESMYKRIEATVLLNGPIIVDTFFNISGFLASFLLLQELHKRQKLNLVLVYLHRFIRITPPYAMVLAFYCTVFVLTGNGPLWNDRIAVEQERCLENWWTNLLYFNNYYNTDRMCMFQSWYLTCDMHLFLLTPLLVWLLWKKPRIGILTTCVLLLISIILVFVKVYVSNEDGILLLYISIFGDLLSLLIGLITGYHLLRQLSGNVRISAIYKRNNSVPIILSLVVLQTCMKLLRDPVLNTQFRTIYIPTHLRASPYFVGILTGYLKYRMKVSGTKIPKALVYSGWIFCIFIMEATVYSGFVFYLPGASNDPLFGALYSSMHHFTWSLCISWMIIAISEGHGSWITPVIAWKPLILLSRITYTAFLCHGAVQLYSAATLRTPKLVSVYTTVAGTASDITLAFVAGLMVSLLFESPIIGLEKFIVKGGDRTDRRKQSELEAVEDISIPKVSVIRINDKF